MKKGKIKITDTVLSIIEHVKGFLLASIVIVSLAGIIVGYRYYRHTQDEPEFCTSCHLMKEPFREWRKSQHSHIICQKCHQLTIIEQNQLLMAFVAGGDAPFSQTHGRLKPWLACKKCHMDEISQGSIVLTKSYGHAMHVFMQRIDCKVCHKGTVHDFHPNEDSCRGCHADKGVHGIGMEAFSCLKCHIFTDKTPSMIPRDRCVQCHKNIPAKGAMSGLLCHQCHKPHEKIRPTSSTCIKECHRNEASVGQHGLHMQKGLDCLYCHKPHSWVVGGASAKALCSKCHSFKDPMLFIY